MVRRPDELPTSVAIYAFDDGWTIERPLSPDWVDWVLGSMPLGPNDPPHTRERLEQAEKQVANKLSTPLFLLVDPTRNVEGVYTYDLDDGDQGFVFDPFHRSLSTSHWRPFIFDVMLPELFRLRPEEEGNIEYQILNETGPESILSNEVFEWAAGNHQPPELYTRSSPDSFSIGEMTPDGTMTTRAGRTIYVGTTRVRTNSIERTGKPAVWRVQFSDTDGVELLEWHGEHADTAPWFVGDAPRHKANRHYPTMLAALRASNSISRSDADRVIDRLPFGHRVFDTELFRLLNDTPPTLSPRQLFREWLAALEQWPAEAVR